MTPTQAPSRTENTSEAETATEEPSMSTTDYQPTLSGALAREHVTDLLRTAAASRAASQLPRHPHHTPRHRPLRWFRATRTTTPHAA